VFLIQQKSCVRSHEITRSGVAPINYLNLE